MKTKIYDRTFSNDEYIIPYDWIVFKTPTIYIWVADFLYRRDSSYPDWLLNMNVYIKKQLPRNFSNAALSYMVPFCIGWEKYAEIHVWIIENLTGHWNINNSKDFNGYDIAYFEDADDATKFKIWWG